MALFLVCAVTCARVVSGQVWGASLSGVHTVSTVLPAPEKASLLQEYCIEGSKLLHTFVPT
jgi:hypothetical protein